MTSQLLLLKKKNKQTRRLSLFLYCYYKGICTKGIYLCQAKTKSHNESNTILPNSCQAHSQILAYKIVKGEYVFTAPANIPCQGGKTQFREYWLLQFLELFRIDFVVISCFALDQIKVWDAYLTNKQKCPVLIQTSCSVFFK